MKFILPLLAAMAVAFVHAEAMLCTIDGGHYPAGKWTVSWQGEGRIELSKGQVISSEPGKMVVEIDPKGGGFSLRLRETAVANPVKNIRVVMPGFTAEDAAKNPWHPGFLARWQGMACLRFMDFQLTTDSAQRAWSDRPQPEDATFTKRGVPLELLCDLANRLEADPWFCIPHAADDGYVKSFAKLAGERLAAEREMYVEYSNEVWNAQFAQNRYAGEQGQKLGLANTPWAAAWCYTARRSVEIFHIWEEALGGRGRLVRVLASQAGNPFVAEQILGWQNAGKQADALAIAPYFGVNLAPDGEKPTSAEVAGWNVDKFLDPVEAGALPGSIAAMQGNKKVADRFGLKLIGDEAGQHFVGIRGAENDAALTALLHAANRHRRIGSIYEKYYAGWQAASGDLLCHFSSVGTWSKWGTWGLLENADEPPSASPKFVTTMAWGKSLGQKVMQP